MIKFHSHSIRRKLWMIVFISNFMALLLAGLFLFLLEFNELRNIIHDEISLTAKLIANRSTAAIAFQDANLANENLTTLAENPSVAMTCIFDGKGDIFAQNIKQQTQYKHCPKPIFVSNAVFNGIKMALFEPIFLDEELIGAIFVQVDLSRLYLRKMKFLGLVSLVFMAVLIVSFVISSPLLQVISGPIRRLLNTVQTITEREDYSLRAKKEDDDELGRLVNSFNGMLAMLEMQNQTLIATKNQYLALYDNNPTMIINCDIQGEVISINRFGAELLKIPVKELVGLSVFDLTFPDDKQLLHGLLELCLERPNSVHKQEIRNMRGDGKTIWVRQSARLIVNEEQQENILIVSEDITRTRQLTEKIAYQASHDALTSLVNRTKFEEHIKIAVESARNEQVQHTLCYLDLDQFKVVNDTCGHTAGDELLRQLSQILKHNIRCSDVLARLGGDEFGILMQNCTLDSAIKKVDKILGCIRDFQFAWEESSFTVGISIGVTCINNTSGNYVDLLKEADAACYVAKDNGRNRMHIFRPDDKELALRQGEMQWVSRIRKAMKENRFSLFGQQIVPLSQSKTPTEPGFHFETLIRLRDDQGNWIPPGAFLPAAERYNLSPNLDRWVFSTLLEWLAKHPEFLEQLSVCAINLSGLSLSENSFLDFIIQEFKKWPVPAHKICFEITETAAISNLTNATKFINRLKQEQCLFSLDDFGSGLSSFGYLKNLPVDFLKIDGLFVKDIETDLVDLAMVRSINEVGHVLGKKTIAEFVENQEIIDILETLGVDYAQGYCIGKPIPLEELWMTLKSSYNDLSEVTHE